MLLWPTFCIHTEMLPVERVVADWERPAKLGPLYSLASLYKTAKACPALDLDQTCLNKKGAAHHWLSSYEIGLVSVNPLMSYIKPPFTPPSPLSLASFFGCWEWQEILAVLAKTVGRLWSDVRGEVWFGSIFQQLIVLWWCDLGLFILESFSGFKVLSFDIFWDLGRWLFIEGQ